VFNVACLDGDADGRQAKTCDLLARGKENKDCSPIHLDLQEHLVTTHDGEETILNQAKERSTYSEQKIGDEDDVLHARRGPVHV
jgi:hypothetical protein